MFAINPSSRHDPCGDAFSRAALDALGEAVDWAYGGPSLARSRHRGRFADIRPRVGLSEALSDPIVQALMAADGNNRDGVEAMMRDVATRLASRSPRASHDCDDRWRR